MVDERETGMVIKQRRAEISDKKLGKARDQNMARDTNIDLVNKKNRKVKKDKDIWAYGTSEG